jgi:hypothetical protein
MRVTLTAALPLGHSQEVRDLRIVHGGGKDIGERLQIAGARGVLGPGIGITPRRLTPHHGSLGQYRLGDRSLDA